MGKNLSMLFASQRDEHSAAAERVASAVAAAGPGADAATLDAAISETYQDIAEDQRPRRSPTPAGHQAEFADDPDNDPDLSFADAEPSIANHRTDPRFLLTDDEPDPEPAPAPTPRPAAWERHAAQPAPEPEYLPPPEPEPVAEPAQAAPTWRARLRDIDARHVRKIGLYGISGGLLVVAIVASFMVTGRGGPPEPAVQVAPPTAANDVPAPTAKEQVLIPAQVSASCANDSDAVAPFANDKTRAFVCKRLHNLDLNVLNISFACPVVITSITVVPGWNHVAPDGRDEWIRHRLTTGISWRMGGAVYPQPIVPTRTGVTMKVPNIITQEMSATVTSSMRPPMGESKSDDFGSKADESAKVDEFTAIGVIKIMGYPVDPGSGLCGPTSTGGQP